MGTELATMGGNAMQTKLSYADTLAKSGMLPASFKGNPGNVLWAIEFGEALGIEPITAITQVHVIQGKPCASANLISALVRRAGHKLRVTATDTEATAEIVRCDDPDYKFTATWTIARARQAELLGNPTWKKFPASMLKARAITECARMACEEALNGLDYTPEELGATVSESGTPESIVESAPVEQPQAAKWTDTERAHFCAQLKPMGLKYDDVAAWCESIGLKRPSVMKVQNRATCLRVLAVDGARRAEFDAWLAAKNAPAVQDAQFDDGTPDDAPTVQIDAPAAQWQPTVAQQSGAEPCECATCGAMYAYAQTENDRCALHQSTQQPLM